MFSGKVFDLNSFDQGTSGSSSLSSTQSGATKGEVRNGIEQQESFWSSLKQQLDVAENIPEEARDHVCDNCGKMGKALRCKTCRQAYFCSEACRREYEPFHQRWCKRNDFADAIEEREPDFAKWMRTHGRQAVITDRDIAKIQDKPSYDLSDYYGKATREPVVPEFTEEEVFRVKQKQEEEHKRKKDQSLFLKAWNEFSIPEGLGAECDLYKWKQSLAYVYVCVRLPPTADSSVGNPKAVPLKRKVVVLFHSTTLKVLVNGEPYLSGELCKEIEPESSTWVIDQVADILDITLLKRWRRDHYKTNQTNADTWWNRLLLPYDDPDPHRSSTSPTSEEAVIPLKVPPSDYYSAPVAYE